MSEPQISHKKLACSWIVRVARGAGRAQARASVTNLRPLPRQGWHPCRYSRLSRNPNARVERSPCVAPDQKPYLTLRCANQRRDRVGPRISFRLITRSSFTRSRMSAFFCCGVALSMSLWRSWPTQRRRQLKGPLRARQDLFGRSSAPQPPEPRPCRADAQCSWQSAADMIPCSKAPKYRSRDLRAPGSCC